MTKQTELTPYSPEVASEYPYMYVLRAKLPRTMALGAACVDAMSDHYYLAKQLVEIYAHVSSFDAINSLRVFAGLTQGTYQSRVLDFHQGQSDNPSLTAKSALRAVINPNLPA